MSLKGQPVPDRFQIMSTMGQQHNDPAFQACGKNCGPVAEILATAETTHVSTALG